MEQNPVLDALLGVTIGDALGVPYEFSSREQMRKYPAKGMVGHGTHNQPKGTWSDDSSLTFCLAESLVEGYHLVDIAKRFIWWKEKGYWTARGRVFDIGSTTSKAISRLAILVENEDWETLNNQKQLGEESENGNGSLMRIIPLLFDIKGLPIAQQFDKIWEVSALTHRHIRAAMSCLIYLKLAEKILLGVEKSTAYHQMQAEIAEFWDSINFPLEEQIHFKNIIQQDIKNTNIEDLKSGGYVIEVLESSIWFFLQKDTYEETVLSIINLGHDIDTSAAIAGGLAGLYYGMKGIPDLWLAFIARLEDIMDLSEKLYNKISV